MKELSSKKGFNTDIFFYFNEGKNLIPDMIFFQLIFCPVQTFF